MTRALPLARLGFRSPVNNPEAMRAALAVCRPREVALSLLGSWFYEQQRSVQSALHARDLGEDSRASKWVQAQLKRRRSYYKDRVLPLLEAAGSPVSYPDAVASWSRWLRDEPDTISVV